MPPTSKENQHESAYDLLMYPPSSKDGSSVNATRYKIAKSSVLRPWMTSEANTTPEFHLDIVRVLRSSGADIGLEWPVWNARDHRCKAVPREVWQRVMYGLWKPIDEGGRKRDG
ncbi:hypothetical protein HBI42_105280 [Parastagonospora nodorum]|nr:hypothetical protein HBI22_143360 [Parastagonospora nodorum]KAH6258053.1 hypothetical protein HBI42_105280 [Parastagonospora nodorum]